MNCSKICYQKISMSLIMKSFSTVWIVLLQFDMSSKDFVKFIIIHVNVNIYFSFALKS